jgi:hypothetical protein
MRIDQTPYRGAAESVAADGQPLIAAFKLSFGESRVKQRLDRVSSI